MNTLKLATALYFALTMPLKQFKRRYRRRARFAARIPLLPLESLEDRCMPSADPVAALSDAANVGAISRNQSDYGMPMIPLYLDYKYAGAYGLINDVARVTLDGNDPEFARGTSSFRATWNGLGGNGYFQWGLGFGVAERPRDIPDFGMARAIRFWGNPDVHGRQIQINVFQVSGQTFDPQPIASQWVALSSGWNEYVVAIPPTSPRNLHAVQILMDSAHDPGGGTVRLDEVRISTDGFDPLRVIQSFRGKWSNSAGADSDFFPDHSMLYDNAVAIKALVASGTAAHITLARNIGDAILATAPNGSSGYFNQMRTGHILLGDGTPRSPHNSMKSVGDNAWFALALLDLYNVTNNSLYLTRARQISDWIEANFKDTGILKGYRGGFDSGGFAFPWRATEHNADMFELNTQISKCLAVINDPAASTYAARASHAGDFVISMFDGVKFWTGTGAGDVTNTSSIPTDAQLWTYLTLGQSPQYAAAINWSLPLAWVENNLLVTDGPFTGVTYSSQSTPNRFWPEGETSRAIIHYIRNDLVKYQQALQMLELAANPVNGVKVQYGLDTRPQSFNARGANEWYFHSRNGSNPSGGGWYVLMPDNKLYAWDGVSIPSTIFHAPVAEFLTTAYLSTNVYADPALLWNSVSGLFATSSDTLVDSFLGADYYRRSAVAPTGWFAALLTLRNLFNINVAPSFSTISNQVVAPGAALQIPFTISDPETPVAAVVVTATSSNTTVLPNGSITLGGAGANRTITITAPVLSSGTTTITLTATDVRGSVGTRSFLLRVGSNAAPTMSAISNQSSLHGTPLPAINLGVQDADGDSVTATVTLKDPLVDVKNQFGLTNPPIVGFYNFWGGRERYFQSTNGSNPAGGGYFVLLPNNKLYAWAGNLNATLLTTPVADFNLAPYNRVDVWSNTALLTSNTGTPLVTVDNPLTELKRIHGLDTPAAYFNSRHANEWYIHSSNGSNAAAGGWYILLPNNTLIAWDGSSFANGTLVADLTPYGNVYGNPALLTDAMPGNAVGVTANITSPITVFPGGQLTLTPATEFERTAIVTVSVSDGIAAPVTSIFNYTVSNSAPTLGTITDRSIPHKDPSDDFNVSSLVNDPGDATQKVYSVEFLGISASDPIWDVKSTYGLDTADQFFNSRGANEKYFHSSNNSNPGNGGWYVLMPDNRLYAWNGVSIGSMTAGGVNSPFFVADFLTAAYFNTNVYATTALLYNAAKVQPPLAMSNQGPLFDVMKQFGLTNADQVQFFNVRGMSEKYFQSTNGSNPVGGGYFILLPNGELRAWNGVSIPTSQVVADLSTTRAYADPRFLYQAQQVFIFDPHHDAKSRFGLNTRDLTEFQNARGANEKYLFSGNGSNPAGGGYYFLITNAGTTELHVWNGVSIASSPLVATFTGLAVYNTPNLIYSSTDKLMGVTATAGPALGDITLKRNAAFSGAVRVKVTVSDGAQKSSQTFSFTVNNAIPVLPLITNANGTSGSGGVSNINLNETDDDTNLTLRATISDNPLNLLRLQYGLVYQPQFDNAHAAGNRFFLSTGSNAAGGGYYVLKGNILYSWAGSQSASLARAPVGDFANDPYYGGANVQGIPTLLGNATASNLSAIFAPTFTAGDLNLSWQANVFFGQFLVTVYISDGVGETQRTFLVTVNP